MKLSEVKQGDVVKYNVRKKNGELLYAVTYEVLLVRAESVKVFVVDPEFLSADLEITARDFEAFYKQAG